jgi:hypothetical protein
MLPVILLEEIISLQIYSELNRTGTLNSAFEIIRITCNILKNIAMRIILYGVSIGLYYKGRYILY